MDGVFEGIEIVAVDLTILIDVSERKEVLGQGMRALQVSGQLLKIFNSGLDRPH